MDLPSFPSPTACECRYSSRGRLVINASADLLSPSLRAPRAVGTWAGEPFVVAKAEPRAGDMWLVIAQNTDEPRAHIQASINLMGSDSDRAFQHLRHAQGLPNPPMEAFIQEAMFRFKPDPEGSMAAARLGLETVKDPSDSAMVGAMTMLVASLVELDRHAEADAALVAAIEERPEHPQLGRLLKKLRAPKPPATSIDAGATVG